MRTKIIISNRMSCQEQYARRSLHPQAAARTYAAYGGVYIGVALLWLWQVDGVPLRWSDWLGAALSLAGMMVIMWGSKT